ncbi:MAG TPA: SpaA isopeptide-forming pilin-related protein, partial [Symbiobacteriaceae bacterium]|nr:SpaA isopeptide-forming pilin-related protein [Symbiobacteriaceae bacterium]
MDKRLKAAVLLLSMNLSINGPIARVAVAEGEPVSLSLPAAMAVGRSEQLQAMLAEGITASDVTFSVQVRQGETPLPDQWKPVGTDATSDDGFSVQWLVDNPGQYWVRAVATGADGQPVGEDLESATVMGYHVSGYVSFSGTANARIRVQVEGPGLPYPLVAELGQNERYSIYGRYAVTPDLNESGEVMPGSARYHFDLPAGEYKITAYAEDVAEVQSDTASAWMAGTQVHDFGYGPYFVQQGPALAPGAHGLSVAWKPVEPTPVVGADSTIAFTPSYDPNRGPLKVQLQIQPQPPGTTSGPVPENWSNLPLTPQTDGSYTAIYRPLNAGNYWLRAEVIDGQGARVVSMGPPLFAGQPAPVKYPIRGSIVLGPGVEPHRVSVSILGTSLPAPMQAPLFWEDPNLPGRMAYEAWVPTVDLYTVEALLDGQRVTKQVAVTAANGGRADDIVLELPSAQMADVGNGPFAAGSTLKLFGTASAPAGRLVQKVQFGYQAASKEHGPVDTDWLWRTAAPDPNGANGSWSSEWTNLPTGEYWVGMLVQDSAGFRVIRSLYHTIHVENPRLHGSIQVDAVVDRTLVTLTVSGETLAAPKVLQYVPQRPTDGSDHLSADFAPDWLQYEVSLPAGTYTLRAAGGGWADEREVTLQGAFTDVPGMHLPAMLDYPQAVLTNVDPDGIYADGSTIALELSGLTRIKDGTVVTPVFRAASFERTVDLRFESTASFVVSGGKVLVTGTLKLPAGTESFMAPLQVALQSQGGQDLTQYAHLNGAHFARFEESDLVKFTPALSEFVDLRNTDKPLTITRYFMLDGVANEIGSVTFGKGLNLLPEDRRPEDIGWAVNMWPSPGRFEARMEPTQMPGAAGLPATITMKNLSRHLNLTGLSQANLAEQLFILAEGQLDKATITYDAATDTLTVPVKEFRVLRVQKRPALELGNRRIDVNAKAPSPVGAWVSMVDLSGAALPTVWLQDEAGNVMADAINPASITRSGMNGVNFEVKPGLAAGRYRVVASFDGEVFKGELEVRKFGLVISEPLVEAGFTQPLSLTVSNFGFDLYAGETLAATLLTHDGMPIPGGLVSESITPDLSGEVPTATVALKPGLAPGFYRIRFALGNGWEEAGVAVNEPANVYLELKDAAGNPIRHADLHLRFEGLATESPATTDVHLHTDDFGRTAVQLTPGARYRLVTMFSPSYTTPVSLQQPVITAPAANEPDLELSLTIRPVKLRLRDEKGYPIPNAPLALTVPGTANPFYLNLQGDGAVLADLPAGNYTVTEVGPMKTRIPFTVTNTGFDYDLQVPPNVVLTLFDQNDKPAAGASVILRSVGTAAEQRLWLKANEQGELRLLQPTGSTFVIDEIVTAANLVIRPGLQLTVPADGTPLTQAIRNNVRLQVKDERGNVMPNTQVVIKSAEGTAAEYTFSAVTDANGAFGRLLKPGAYRVVEVSNDLRRVKLDLLLQVSATGLTQEIALPQRAVELTVTGGMQGGIATLQIRPKDRIGDNTAALLFQTDRDGTARFDLPRGAAYVLVDVMTPAGRTALGTEFFVPDQGPALQMVSIAPTVDALLLDEQGAVMPNAMVTIKPDNAGVPAQDWSTATQGGTDAAGRLRVRLAPGTYHIVEVSNALGVTRTDLVFTVGANVYVTDFRLVAPNVVVAVTGDGALPVARAMVQIRPANARPDEYNKGIWAETDQNGIAKFQLSAGVAYRIVDVGTPLGVRPVGKEFTAPAKAGAQPIAVNLAANVVATVKDEQGQPMPFALVAIRPDNGNGQPVELPETTIFAGANAQGVFSINLDPGRLFHVVEISTAQRHIRTAIRLPVDNATGYRGDVSVPAPNVSIQVVKGTAPVAKAWVQLRPAGLLTEEWQRSTFVETDAQGVARALLTPGIRYVVVDVGTPEGVTRVGKEFMAPATDLRISLDANVMAPLVDENNDPITQAWVTIRPDDGTGRPVAAYDQTIFAGTNDAGLLSLYLEPGKTYHVVEIGSARRFLRTDIPFTVTANGYRTTLAVPPANAWVRVTGDLGAPVPRAWVQIRMTGARPDDQEKAIWAETDATGLLKVRLAPATSYTVVDVGTPQGITLVGKSFVTPSEGSSNPTVVNVSLAANVVLTLGDERGLPMADTRLTIRPVTGANTPGTAAYERTVFATTDRSGIFRVNLEPGEYRIIEVAAPDRYVKTEIPLSVPVTGPEGTMVRLPAPNVAVTITNGNTGVARAWLQIRPADARPEEYHRTVWTQTDQNGVAQLKLTPGAAYVVVDVGTPQGMTLVNQPFTVLAGPGTTDVQVNITPNVTATLSDENGGLAGAWVTIRSAADPARLFWGNTNEQGQLSISLPAGRYQVTEIGLPDRFIRTNLDLDVSGGSFTGSLSVSPTNVRVAVTHNGAPVARAMVQFRSEGAAPDAKQAAIWAETDDRGIAKVYLPAGNYVLVDVGTPNGVTQVQRPVTVADSGTVELAVSLSAKVTGTLLDENGEPMPWAWLAIKPDVAGKPAVGSSRTLHAKTGSDGRFQINLEPGVYHVVELGNSTRYVRTDLLLTVDSNGQAAPVRLAPTNVSAT